MAGDDPLLEALKLVQDSNHPRRDWLVESILRLVDENLGQRSVRYMVNADGRAEVRLDEYHHSVVFYVTHEGCPVIDSQAFWGEVGLWLCGDTSRDRLHSMYQAFDTWAGAKRR